LFAILLDVSGVETAAEVHSMIRSCSLRVITKQLSPLLLIWPLLFALACRSGDTRAADEAALRKLDDEWSKAAGAKDIEKTVSFYSDDAIVLVPNSPLLKTKEQIRTLWTGMFSIPGFSGGWKPEKIEIARSGDLAYISGRYEINEVDPSGRPLTDTGNYLEIWRKQSDGNWKCVVDTFSSDLQPPSENRPTP
jgi:ketosteroid isomerase-like protein